jgi:hypothetical protein
MGVLTIGNIILGLGRYLRPEIMRGMQHVVIALQVTCKRFEIGGYVNGTLYVVSWGRLFDRNYFLR